MFHSPLLLSFFFFNDTATTEIYTLSLHDALPILTEQHFFSALNFRPGISQTDCPVKNQLPGAESRSTDRKSTRLNSSHSQISYAVFCLKKKKNNLTHTKHYNKQTCIRN